MSPAPDGLVVRLDPGAQWLDEETLFGGAPPRLLRFSKRGRELLGGGEFTVTGAASRVLAEKLLAAGAAHPVLRRARPRPVSVVIPVHGREAELRRLLGALDGTLPDGSEVLVVDDGTPVPIELAGVTVLRHEVSRGPAAARNTGLAAAAAEFVAFLDSDVVPVPGWLDPLLAHFEDPAVALAAPRIVGLRKARENLLARYEHARSSLDLGPDAALIVPKTRVAYVPSAAMVVRVSAVGAGFAAELRVAEDVDLVCRLHASGHRLVYDPSSRVAHEHRDRPVAWFARKAFYGTGAAPLALRHPGTVPPVNLPGWAAAVCVLLGVQRRWSVLAAVALIAVRTVRLRRSLSMLRRPLRTAVKLNAMTLTGAAWQSAGALNRHWWPVALAGAVVSRRFRRALLTTAVAEGVADWWQHRGELDLLCYVVLHRVDDLAYGTGLWRGAVVHSTVAPLLPRFLPVRSRDGGRS
ncbi:mycofactocin biosynthesis glycosyltransferase MftF [Amycolatopsis sp. H20-H5]|uniref:mycofactocin biosynthesis glycosyltransferase MftF n=1 Tax=Amycolatopsis sp. H20-H5 TaxID=3046309 RepID=UPI002DB60057|nr:mycofactocin biosynthesis glycosyltransferase MftF [Amycolatopsis sp. H20-H5]MEC3977295.1 mycofactocin biosynthesis glycosyltransferase MftF [Amycolatopsis sp. H20-H5]